MKKIHDDIIVFIVLVALALILGYFTHGFQTGRMFFTPDTINNMALNHWAQEEMRGGAR